MPPVVQLGLPPAVLATFKESLTCLVVGTILATGVYGITILQAYIYFGNSGRDSIHMKSFVALLFALETLSLVLMVNILCHYVVSDFGNPFLLLKATPIMAWENGVTVLIGTLTQCYFAHRLWALSKGNVALVSSIIILAVCSCGSGMAISVNLYTHKETLFLSSIETRILSGFANGLSVICDVLIAASLSYYLHSKRTGFKRMDSIINRLIIYVVNRGALTAICQAGHMITTVALPGRFIFLPFALLDGRLYCNTLLATLNAQRSIVKEDRKHAVELGSDILNSMNSSTSGNGKQWRTGERSVTESSYDRMSGFLPSTGKTDVAHT